jgi:hypothetical protein
MWPVGTWRSSPEPSRSAWPLSTAPWSGCARTAAPFFGGTLRLAAGVFAVARIAKVPIVPLVARWIGDEIEIVVGDPLPASNDENAMAASAAQWLEQYLRDSPTELSGRILELMSDGNARVRAG